MTAPVVAPDHTWGKWAWSRRQHMWVRRCVIGSGMCTAVQTAPGIKVRGTA